MDLTEFSEQFLTGDEPVIEIGPGADRWPHVVIRNGGYVAVLQLQGHRDHLAVDVHAFVDGRDALAGVFGISDGRRHHLPETGGTSHGWPAARTVTVLVGKQESHRLVWGDAGTGHRGDQNADSRHGGHNYWSLGHTAGAEYPWHVELVVRNCDLDEIPGEGLDLGTFSSEQSAKEAAQEAENDPGSLYLPASAQCRESTGRD